MRDRHPHYIKPLKRGGIPASHIVLDCEAKIAKNGGRYEHRFVCAAVVEVGVSPDGRVGQDVHEVFDSSEDLWSYIQGQAANDTKTVVWAHNMPYDLRVSEAMRHLLRLGWRCEAISLARVSAWCSWKRGKSTIVVCDSYAWLHVPLERLADEMGVELWKIDPTKAALSELHDRCAQDAALLATVVGQLLELLASRDLGPFRPTGSGQSHAAWRKRFLGEREVFVHANHEVLAYERHAMHTGRCEAWRWGPVRRKLHEVDLSLAYCRIAARHALPTKLLGEIPPPGRARHVVTPGRAMMAEVEVRDLKAPLVPLQRGGRVLWPTGTFTTVLWDPELLLLDSLSESYVVKRAWTYETGYALRSMSQWLVGLLDSPSPQLLPVERRVLKHWARTLVGRCALRYSQWEYFGESPWDCLELSHEVAPDLQSAVAHLQVGHANFERTVEREANSSSPAIPGWVQSKCRVLLWRAIEAAGYDNVAYMDTDGLLVTDTGRRALLGQANRDPDAVWVVKSSHAATTIHGPRQVELGAERRISGIPKSALRTDEITWEGELWEGLEQALTSGHHDHVSVMPASWELTPVDYRRRHLPGGQTLPHHIDPNDETED